MTHRTNQVSHTWLTSNKGSFAQLLFCSKLGAVEHKIIKLENSNKTHYVETIYAKKLSKGACKVEISRDEIPKIFIKLDVSWKVPPGATF